MAELLFWLMGGGMVFFTMLTIWSRNPVHCTVFMILSFAATAGLFVMLDAYLIAAMEVLVYAGAILMLFLFVIMMIELRDEEQEGLRLNPLMLVAAATFLLLLGRAVGDLGPVVQSQANEMIGSPAPLAEALFTRFVVPFEAVSLLLLGAILGVVVLNQRSRDERASIGPATPDAGGGSAAPGSGAPSVPGAGAGAGVADGSAS